MKLNTTGKFIGNSVFVSKEMKEKVIAISEEINSFSNTGTTSIETIVDKDLRNFMKSISNRILIKSKKKIDMDKLKKLLKEESSFTSEICATPEIQATANLKQSLRFTYIKSILSRYGRPTKKDIKNILTSLNLEYTDPGADDISELKEISEIFDNENLINEMYKAANEVREGKNAGGKPTVLLDSAATNLSKIALKKKVNVAFIAKPKKRDYKVNGISKPYKGQKAADLLIVVSKKDGTKTGLSLEYYGWSGVSYERNMLEKNIDVAENFGHQYGIISPIHADNDAAARRFTNDIFDREFVKTEKSEIEAAAYRWVLNNDKYTGISTEDAIYNGIYGVLNEVGLARKLMPSSKLKLFRR